jgi:hypothetical protein
MSGNYDDQNDQNDQNGPFSTDLSLITQHTPPNRVFSILCNNIIAFLATNTTIPMVVNESILRFIGDLRQSFNSANNGQKSRLIIVAGMIHEYVNNFAQYYRYQHLNITNFAIAIGDNSVDLSLEFSEYHYIVEVSITFTDSPNPTG